MFEPHGAMLSCMHTNDISGLATRAESATQMEWCSLTKTLRSLAHSFLPTPLEDCATKALMPMPEMKIGVVQLWVLRERFAALAAERKPFHTGREAAVNCDALRVGVLQATIACWCTPSIDVACNGSSSPQRSLKLARDPNGTALRSPTSRRLAAARDLLRRLFELLLHNRRLELVIRILSLLHPVQVQHPSRRKHRSRRSHMHGSGCTLELQQERLPRSHAGAIAHTLTTHTQWPFEQQQLQTVRTVIYCMDMAMACSWIC